MSYPAILPNDSEFLAEETIVTITSGINHPQFKFISGLYGPLEAGLPCQIPLWLAITLRKKGKCTISTPTWMNVDSLETVIKNEKDGNVLESIPFYYIEIGNLLLTHAKEDITSADRVSTLLQDLENIRLDRMKLAIGNMAEMVKVGEKVYKAAVTNISSMEIISIQDFVSGSLAQFRALTTTKEDNFKSGSSTTTAYEADDNQRRNDGDGGSKKLRRFRN